MTDRPQHAAPDPGEGAAAVAPEERDDRVPPGLREPAEQSFESPGEPERELRPARRPRRPRRAHRPGTNPGVDDVPDVAPPRDPGTADDSDHDRWLRAQRPPHWE
ncbi:hypothetical protein [Oryzobacter telluris]|uniref:hypothetical protein n=1 Tax=Oryzobacter telluris TaxID=3149179 RepID=UPI00370D105D